MQPIRAAIAEWLPKLEAIRAEWASRLPADAASTWRRGAAYVRESSVGSLVGDAPAVQLQHVLRMLALRRVFVGPDAIFFDVGSGTDIAGRGAFVKLYEQAMAGGFEAIGVFLSERLFRSVELAGKFKRDFRKAGIDLIYEGKFEGDQRSPAAYQLETIQDLSGEVHARNTSFYVGTHYETVSHSGRPVGKLPEAYESIGRGPTLAGRRGAIAGWRLVEPLASIIKTGCEKYLAGSSLAEIAAWSLTTPLAGRTPAKRVMNKTWWYMTLTNPKFAGYHLPSIYQGFRPGKISPKRRRRTMETPASEFIPCQLPPLWDFETFLEIRKRAHSEYVAQRRRSRYRTFLLSGVAYDAACEHRMFVSWIQKNGRHSFRCGVEDPTGPHASAHRGDIAEREFDEIIGKIHFDDPELLAEVDAELKRLAIEDSSGRGPWRADPAIAKVRQALAALEAVDAPEARRSLIARLADLERSDAERRRAESRPVTEFGAAVDELRRWSEIWKEADAFRKNKLLRQAGVKAFLAPDPGPAEKPPFHLVEIRSTNPIFNLALATVLKPQQAVAGPDGLQNCKPTYVAIAGAGSRSLREVGANPTENARVALLRVIRPMIYSGRLPAEVAAGPWLTVPQFAAATGLAQVTVRLWITEGKLRTLGGQLHGRWRVIHADEVTRIMERGLSKFDPGRRLRASLQAA